VLVSFEWWRNVGTLPSLCHGKSRALPPRQSVAFDPRAAVEDPSLAPRVPVRQPLCCLALSPIAGEAYSMPGTDGTRCAAVWRFGHSPIAWEEERGRAELLQRRGIGGLARKSSRATRAAPGAVQVVGIPPRVQSPLSTLPTRTSLSCKRAQRPRGLRGRQVRSFRRRGAGTRVAPTPLSHRRTRDGLDDVCSDDDGTGSRRRHRNVPGSPRPRRHPGAPRLGRVRLRRDVAGGSPRDDRREVAPEGAMPTTIHSFLRTKGRRL